MTSKEKFSMFNFIDNRIGYSFRIETKLAVTNVKRDFVKM